MNDHCAIQLSELARRKAEIPRSKPRWGALGDKSRRQLAQRGFANALTKNVRQVVSGQVVGTIHGKRQALFFTPDGLIAAEAVNGKTLLQRLMHVATVVK